MRLQDDPLYHDLIGTIANYLDVPTSVLIDALDPLYEEGDQDGLLGDLIRVLADYINETRDEVEQVIDSVIEDKEMEESLEDKKEKLRKELFGE